MIFFQAYISVVTGVMFLLRSIGGANTYDARGGPQAAVPGTLTGFLFSMVRDDCGECVFTCCARRGVMYVQPLPSLHVCPPMATAKVHVSVPVAVGTTMGPEDVLRGHRV